MMIKIVKERLDQGFDLLTTTEKCRNSHNCLWISRPRLLKILPPGCSQEKCDVILFRQKLEDESPAFYAEALKLSLFDDVAQTTTVLSMKRKMKQKKLKRLGRRTFDLHLYSQLLILAIYSLSLEVQEIPFLKPSEIIELKKNYGEQEMHATVKEMSMINHEWLEWIESIMGEFVTDYERYTWAINYLVYLFLKGMEKNQLPDLRSMPLSEKNSFFADLNNTFFKTEK